MESMLGVRAHWEQVYAEKDPREVSWFEPTPERSLSLIEATGVGRDAAILDVGGGASSLGAQLLEAGYTDVTVADLAASALKHAQAQLGDEAARITWLEADIRDHDFGRLYDLWHDRAVFHFMVDPGDREGYLAVLRRTLRPGGHLLLATFGPEGPTQCSGLPVVRYGSGDLSRALDQGFELLSSSLQEHITPAGNPQQFHYARLIRAA